MMPTRPKPGKRSSSSLRVRFAVAEPRSSPHPTPNLPARTRPGLRATRHASRDSQPRIKVLQGLAWQEGLDAPVWIALSDLVEFRNKQMGRIQAQSPSRGQSIFCCTAILQRKVRDARTIGVWGFVRSAAIARNACLDFAVISPAPIVPTDPNPAECQGLSASRKRICTQKQHWR